jgi:hypothetical protein
MWELAWYVRVCWAAVSALEGLCALSWWMLMPSGFAVAHPRFWSNEVLPWLWIGTAALGFYASVRAPALLQWIALVPLAALLSALIAIRVSHPLTAGGLHWWAMVALAVPLAGLVLVTMRRGAQKWQLLPGLAFIGVGAGFSLSLRAPSASTRPLGALEVSSAPAVSDDGVVVYQQQRMRLELSPFLTFGSRSPDGAWTLFAPPHAGDMEPPSRCILYRTPAESNGSLRAEAQCELAEPVFSHLNDYASLRVSGHKHLSIAFSPVSDAELEVMPADYPEGRAVRFGYLGEDETFRVVEADSAEKGPFHQLGAGQLRRGDPLTLTLLDEGKARLRVTFFDWAAQASTDTSPSAGWGVPQNAVTFQRFGNGDNSQCEIALTLAATGTGRGFDSVAHAAGVYRNRVEIAEADSDREVP